MSETPAGEHSAEKDARSHVISYVRRLIDYGKGYPDPEFDDATLGQIADRIIARVTASADPEPQPTDGPDYHADHAAWTARQTAPIASAETAVGLMENEIQKRFALSVKVERAEADLAAMTGFRDECERQYQVAIHAQGQAEADLADEKRRHGETLTRAALDIDKLLLRVAGFSDPWDRGYCQGVQDAAYSVRERRALLDTATEETDHSNV